MMKKLISFLLVVSMLLALVPAVFAEDTQVSAEDQTVEQTADEVEGTEAATDITQIYEDPQALEELVEDAMLIFFGAGSDAENLQVVARMTKSGYVARSASNEILNVIKAQEGFCKYPVWDVQQWSIGYGSRCPESPSVKDYDESQVSQRFKNYVTNGISQSEAETLLLDFVNDNFAPSINSVAKKYNIALSQNQFDALISFTYNLGAGWTSGCRLTSSLINGYHENTGSTVNAVSNSSWYLINSMGTWCHVNGAAHPAIATRRVLEMEIFNYGNYYTSYTQLKNSGKAHYTYLFFDANGGTCVNPSDTSDWSVTNRFYFIGSPYKSLMNAKRDGYVFDGWYTSPTGGTKITESTIAQLSTSSSYYAGMTVYAHWKETSATGYTDVKETDWFAEAVMKATEKGLFSGFTDGTFRPNEILTRAMAVSVLYRLSGEEGSASEAAEMFTDVPEDAYYAKAVGWAASKGIVAGVTEDEFRPNQQVTREQIASMLYRYYVSCGGDPLDYVAPGSQYTDFNQISSYAIVPMCWAVTNGLISGDSATTLSPKKSATRAQAAAIFVRFDEAYN